MRKWRNWVYHIAAYLFSSDYTLRGFFFRTGIFFFFFRTGLVGARSCQALLAYGRKGSRLGAEAPASARISPRGRSAELVGHWGARQSSPSSVGHKARWTATPRRPHQRRRHPAAAAVRTAGGARRARRRTRRRTKVKDSVFQRPPTSQARTRSCCGPSAASSG